VNPKFKIVAEGGFFVIMDGNGTRYGAYSDKASAEVAMTDWSNYYTSDIRTAEMQE
jgi:hypothetical protein